MTRVDNNMNHRAVILFLRTEEIVRSLFRINKVSHSNLNDLNLERKVSNALQFAYNESINDE